MEPDRRHIPVLMAEVLAALDPQPGEIAADGTLGAAGHALELFRRVTPGGRLIACDLDPANLEPAMESLFTIGDAFDLHHANFSDLPALSPDGVDVLLADLGVSSMQIDDPARGFSYRRPGPLDLRMNPAWGPTAAQWLRNVGVEELTTVLNDFGDFTEFGPVAGKKLAQAICDAKPTTTQDLTRVVLNTTPPPKPPPGRFVKPWQLKYRPVACAFQAIRIAVNRELASLHQLLMDLPRLLRPGGRAAIITFHSGEDRLVKQAFRAGLRAGEYEAVADAAVRASPQERYDNPRSRSAKLRWARRPR
ncbi:MAG: 16S rRNA (cytosine(1402)-N(4))-methyltransferase RsmH [Gemmataceae bacterium]|nr:16S rRNA (cytosine(1402)-N(4))-methyltransferase RsmH [Gemmataceae bacterium]